MAKIDILVIGGGIVGLTAAIAAAREGARVTVIDAAINAGSTANAGSLHVQMQSRFIRLYPEQAPNVEASLPLYLEAVKEWERLDAELGPFELVRKGGLMLAESQEQMAFLEKKAARERQRGLTVELLDRPALDRLAPWLGAQIVGAELCRDEGKLNPLVANVKLRQRAVALGVEFGIDRAVELVSRSAVTVLCASGARYVADRVILAAAWGVGELVKGLGLHLPVNAEPLHMNITEAGAGQINHLVQHAERTITLKQFGSGQIVIGGGWAAQSRGNVQVPAVLADSMLGNVALAARLVPAIGHLRVIRTWAGMNTTLDGMSLLGAVPGVERVIMAIPGDAGYTLGPLCGRTAACLALAHTPSIDVERLSARRFSA
ncbi:NAD(P)/FAD-dependent oxidoreductase [Hoeflea ulvae]|uniref:FAD-binding oxidoreductase n=1 Tax=Hoeflea ulvae TaxID=2983764 RepID=A0ABT3YD46_9HYPH|nr:FAD-binding oxidoreductase [Hoeflea ulvae]MCY0093805.1 FAD-binding oxidoreductase [Hoeflea ulvae]